MKGGNWDLLILDAAPPATELGGLTVGDLDGDGHIEIVASGHGALLWYRPDTFEKGVIAEGDFGVGLELEDLDSDGIMEVVAGSGSEIVWFKPESDLHRPWTRHVIDPATNGGAHDIVFFDIDGDGKRELVANAVLCETPGLFVYKSGKDPTRHWDKHAVVTGIFSEGLAAADLDGDGRVEIVHGPDWFSPPAEGPFSGPWKRKVYAPPFREMCRIALADITGNGRPDVAIVESEYVDGRMSWFENRLVEDPGNPWVEHEMDRDLNFAHSLNAWRDTDSNEARVFLAEMAAGGWDQPYNWNARLIEYITSDGGKTWRRGVLYKGAGTHQAVACDVDRDGVLEIVGKEWGKARTLPRVQIWKRREEPSPLMRFRHRLLDRDKPYAATDILTTDVDGDGHLDVVCGAWWYKNFTWERRDIPGVSQVINAYDIDGDGRDELIATKRVPTGDARGLSNELCWLKPIDPLNGRWEEHPIGRGGGDWPHGSAVAPVLPGGKLALITGYHSADRGDPPEIFEVPDDPKQYPWPKRVLADIPYGEEIISYDLDGDGKLDLVAGPYWLKNLGNGAFEPRKLADVSQVARIRIADVNGDGNPDILCAIEAVDYSKGVATFVPITWLENPGDLGDGPWRIHVIDKARSPHSLDVADLDGDGELEVIVGEHDPFKPYRSRSQLMVYKKADPQGRAWFRYVLDDRFEHHDGTKVLEIAPGRFGIISHGWADSRYVHLWEVY